MLFNMGGVKCLDTMSDGGQCSILVAFRDKSLKTLNLHPLGGLMLTL